MDDEAFVRRTLRRMLSQYDIALAANGKEAIELIDRAEKFDVILCDLMMPLVNGIDVYYHVHEQSAEQAERIVFLTGGTIDDTVDTFLAEVPNTVLDKPFSFEQLRLVIEQVATRG
ncbi:MAG: response regulator [Myxococcota bacterium]